MAPTTTFQELNRKQAFDGLVQEVVLLPRKQYTDLESYMDDLVEYLQPQMDEMLRAKDLGIQFNWSPHVKYSTPLMKIVDYDKEENLFRCHDDDDEKKEEYDTPVYLHSGKLQIKNREQLAAKMTEARQRIIETSSDSIHGKSNQVIVSIGKVLFKVINQNNKRVWSGKYYRQDGWRREHSTTYQ